MWYLILMWAQKLQCPFSSICFYLFNYFFLFFLLPGGPSFFFYFHVWYLFSQVHIHETGNRQ